MPHLEHILRETFQLESFREGQKEVIEHILTGSDALVFMPTGWGKSLTYQLPGIVLPGLTIVISPLISLMKDQIDKLNHLGIRSEAINSTLTSTDQQRILDELRVTDFSEWNPIKFLYIAPERLNSSEFLRVIETLPINLVAIDEAHCISQWGHDFRPSYMRIRGFLEKLKKHAHFPTIALTATATHKVRQDIIDRLGSIDFRVFTRWFDRKNIIILVREISASIEKLTKTLEIIEKTSGSWIIYCSSRKTVQEVYEFLLEHNVSTGMYTGAMTPDNREEMQNNFMNEKTKVIVATNAFGMGIDKKDIRFVIHYNLPGSIENYYQEVGRAGRDGKLSYGVVLASYGDTKIQEFFINNTYPERKNILAFYEYLTREMKIGEGAGTKILKTNKVMAKESRIDSEMEVSVILRLFEKYEIIFRGIDGEEDVWFRGKGLTLLCGKMKSNNLPIDWKHQELLKKESLFKLEQIKRLLFSPSCRKWFILDYFGDTEDLATLGENCGKCDYCIDKTKKSTGVVESVVNLSVFEIVLETVARFDRRFGINVIAYFLEGTRENKLTELGISDEENYGVLAEYSRECILGLIAALAKQWFLEKTFGLYPLIGITEKGRRSLKNEQLLRAEERELQTIAGEKIEGAIFAKKRSSTMSRRKPNVRDWETGTHRETQRLFESGMTIAEIAEERGLAVSTIETHLLKLHEKGIIEIEALMKLLDPDEIATVRKVLIRDFAGNPEKLSAVKQKLEELGFPRISYHTIRVAVLGIKVKK